MLPQAEPTGVFYRGNGLIEAVQHAAWRSDSSNRHASVVVPARTDSTLSMLARAKTIV